MTVIRAFSDGIELSPCGIEFPGLAAYTDDECIYFRNGYIKLYNIYNGNYINIRLVGFTIDIGEIIKNKLTESDIEQLEIIYESAKDFLADLDNLGDLHKHVRDRDVFGNISIHAFNNEFTVSICETGSRPYKVFRVCDIEYGPSGYTQQESEIVIMELVNKLVIYNPKSIMTKSANPNAC